MRTTRTPATPCPSCRRILDATTDATGDHQPAIDDLTVCAYCAAVLTFTATMGLRVVTTDEIDALRPVERAQLHGALRRVERRQRAQRTRRLS